MRLIFLAFLVMSCASASKIVPEGPDSYVIIKRGGSLDSGAMTKANAIEEANKYCADKGKEFVIQRSSHQNASLDYASAEIGFKCLDKGDPDLKRPNLQPVPNTRVEVR